LGIESKKFLLELRLANKQIKMATKGKTTAGMTCLEEDTRLRDQFNEIINGVNKMDVHVDEERAAMSSIHSIYDSRGFSKPNKPGTTKNTEEEVEEAKTSKKKKKHKISADLLEQLEESNYPSSFQLLFSSLFLFLYNTLNRYYPTRRNRRFMGRYKRPQ
jgi:hypothetical protein